MSTNARRLLPIAGAAGACLLASCANPTAREHYFSADSYVTAATGIDPDAAVARAIDELMRRGAAAGLRLERRSGDSVVLTGTLPSGGGESADGSLDAVDQRRVTARAWFDTTDGGVRYRYRVFLDGQRPAGTTPEHERRAASALLAVREIFETPVAVEAPDWPPVRARQGAAR